MLIIQTSRATAVTSPTDATCEFVCVFCWIRQLWDPWWTSLSKLRPLNICDANCMNVLKMPLLSSKKYLPRRRLVRVTCCFVVALFFGAIISYASTGLKLHGRDVGLTTSAGGLAKSNENYPAIVTTLSTVPCDSECRRFRRLMALWPRDKPKAALVYLVYRFDYMESSIRSVGNYFCRKFDYPIIIFHEADLFKPKDEMPSMSKAKAKDVLLKAAEMNSSRVFFQLIEFKIPQFLTKPVPGAMEIPCFSAVGYRNMCRFQAKGKPEINIIECLIAGGALNICRVAVDIYYSLL